MLLPRVLDLLSTKEELTYVVNCSGNKYELGFTCLRVLEGSDELIERGKYCGYLSPILSITPLLLHHDIDSETLITALDRFKLLCAGL